MDSNLANEWCVQMEHAHLASDRRRARRALHLRDLELLQGRGTAKAPSATPLRRLGLALVRFGGRLAPRDTAAGQV